MKVFHDVLDALSGDLATGQEPQVIEGERLSALVMKMHVERLSASSISIIGGSFVLSNMEEILENWDEEDCYILAKVKLKNLAKAMLGLKKKFFTELLLMCPYLFDV